VETGGARGCDESLLDVRRRSWRRPIAELLVVEGVRRAQVWAMKASVSDPLRTCRKHMGGIETGRGVRVRDESGGCLLIGQVVSGVEVARAWSGLRCGTWEPVVPRPRAASGAAWACPTTRTSPLRPLAGDGAALGRMTRAR
jgi:hypothetical protein